MLRLFEVQLSWVVEQGQITKFTNLKINQFVSTEIRDALTEGNCALGIHLDLSKSFDTGKPHDLARKIISLS